MKKLFALLLLAVLALVLSSCGTGLNLNKKTTTDPTSSTQDVTDDSKTQSNYRISTRNPYVDMYAGETAYLQYTLNFDLPSGEALEFSSTNPEVARVLSTGYVIARSKGTCNVIVSYMDASLTFIVTVDQDSSIEVPQKLSYYTDEELDLTGCEILYYNNDRTISKVIDVTSDMVSSVDMTTTGEKQVTVNYNGETYSFYINVIERAFEPLLIKTISVSDGMILSYDSMDIRIEPKNLSRLKEEVSSVYDYTEFKILVDITSPSGKTDTLYTYYTQDYSESKRNLASMNTSRNYEGNVFSRANENYELTYNKVGDPYYNAKYIPTEVGTYTYTVRSYSLDTTLVETLGGEFYVNKGTKTKGKVGVASNKRTFEFEDGSTYAAVGENVAWYTSAQRRYGDYDLIFKSLADNNCNYARVWLSGFSFALFWDDVENYDNRLDEAYELDKLFELASDLGIYINLTLYHHGMFSANVNPMWPNTSNTWYLTKYGANPYSKHFDDPGDFFYSNYGKKWCKNYLTYIVARYGYADSLLSYELFNEVDWVESYTATDGALWHDEMAKYIKGIDYRGHMVTTSVKGDDFSSSIYQVFNLSSIDYVNVHNYGTKNYATTICKKAQTAYSKFDKPLIYQEVGYDGNSGSSQYEKDPNNITLHQELWGGLMATCASGMNWWWDSWIEPHDCYDSFYGAGTFAKLMDLSGNLTLAYGSSRVTCSSTNNITLGYLFNNKAYLYVFNKNYGISNTSTSINSTLTLKNMDNGSYTVQFFDTNLGRVTSTSNLTASSGNLSISISGSNDIALIITKK